MTLKICHNNQIHRISKLPSDYASLIKTVSLLFENQLPPQWTLQYIDSDGDHVMLSDEHDFANLVEDGLLSSTKAVKVFIFPLSEGQNPAHSQILAHEPPKVDSPRSDEFQFLEKPAEEQNSIPHEEESTNYQEIDLKEEQKPLLADESVRLDEQPPLPEAPRERSRSQRKLKLHKVKKVMKKLARESLSPEKRTKLEEKMRKLDEKLTPEQREKLNKKKEKIAKRQAEKQAKRKTALKDAVTDIIYEHLPTIASLAKDLLQEERPSKPQEESNPSKVVHARIECDGCGEGPIVGVRYKCSVCPDFDYCERCEARIEHPHPFIKLKTPNQDAFMPGPHDFMRGFCGGFGGRGGCRRQRSPKQCPRKENMKEFHDKLNEFKQTDSFKNIIGSLFTGARPNKEDEEKAQKDVQQLYSTLPQNAQEKITSHYNNLPQELKNNINKFLGGLPEQVLNKQQDKEEVKIEEETLIKATEPEIPVKENEPLIQEVEIKVEVEEKKPEPEEPVVQKEFSPEIKAKAQSLKDIFEEADINNLLEFVSQAPEMSLEELVENYLSL